MPAGDVPAGVDEHHERRADRQPGQRSLAMPAQPTVKTSPNGPMNSVTYLRMCDPLTPREQLRLIPARDGKIRMSA
jgi:hypothetical protein